MKSPKSPQLILFAEASLDPASPYPSPGSEKAQTISDGSGQSSTGQFAKLSPDGFWLKMFQDCCQRRLDGSLEVYSETWPKAGMMRSGMCYRQRSLGRRTCDSGCFLWPTPQAMDCITRGKESYKNQVENQRKGRTIPLSKLADIIHVQTLPTPANRDYRSPNKNGNMQDQLPNVIGGQLNPTWVEWLMGYPQSWTELLGD